MASILELQDLYNEALVRELIEKTKSCGLIWSFMESNQFVAESDDTNDVKWTFYLIKTNIGNVSEKFNLDIRKDDVNHVSIENGPLPRTGRTSAVKELYEMVEILVLQLDSKLKETVKFVQELKDCRS